MSTAILTPLFPPDTSISAQYVKQLAVRAPRANITVIAYGSYPESVENTLIISIDKRSNKLQLVFRCLRRLLQLSPRTLIVQNGPSSELPALLYSYIRSVDLVFTISDLEAATKPGTLSQRLVTGRLRKRAAKVLNLPTDQTLYLQPEWLPFETKPLETVRQDIWWEDHLQQVFYE